MLEKWLATYFKAPLTLFQYIDILICHNLFSGHKNREKMGQKLEIGENSKIGENRGKLGEIGILFIYIKIHTNLHHFTKFYQKYYIFG